MDNNNTELSNKEIGLITSDFVKVSDQLKNTCNKIIEKNFRFSSNNYKQKMG